jgi:hypothetical protein
VDRARPVPTERGSHGERKENRPSSLAVTM